MTVRANPPEISGSHLSADAVPSPLWVLLGLAMAPTVSLGLARFAYALLVPAMRHDLAWSYAEAGLLNGVNAVGYLVGALVAARVAARFGARVSVIACLVVTCAALLGSGLTASFPVLVALRTVAGVAGAVAFVAGGGLAAAAGAGVPGRSALALSIYVAGAGFGIALSALAVPAVQARFGWQGGWIALAAVALAASAFGAAAVARAPSAPPRPLAAADVPVRVMAPVLVSYALFGAGYIAYMTFIIDYLQASLGFAPPAIVLFWTLLGGAAMAGAFAWGHVLGRVRGGRGVVATTALVTIGAALPVVWTSEIGALVSAAIFGGSFLAVVAAVTSFARTVFPPHAWTAAIGTLTAAFALGQCVGPVISGLVADGAAGVGSGLLLSAGVLAVATVVALFQRATR